MRRAVWALALLATSCTELVPTQRGVRPDVTILTPATDAEVPYNTAFHLSAVARAPEGTLSQVHIVLRGEASTEQTVPLSGAEADIELDLIVPQDALLGEDHRPLDLVLIVESVVDGVTVAAAPQGVTLQMLDRTAPTLQLYSPDALPTPPEGIDLSVPAGQSFTLGLSAEDAIGGVVYLGFDAPSVLGGLRALQRPAGRSARFEAVFSPPVNGDFDIEIFAEDAARVSNRTARKVRVRVGAGGTDDTPPELHILAPAEVQCRDVAQLVVTATDAHSGVERLWLELELDGQAQRIFSRDQVSATTLSWTGTVAAPGPAGRPLLVRAAAHNFFGRVSPIETATITTVDHLGPQASAILPAVLAPGGTATVTLSAQEACGTLSAAQLVLTDAAGTSTTVSASLSAPNFSGDLSFLIPDHLCTTSALQAALHVLDNSNNSTLAAQGALSGEDRVGPSVDIGLLLPGAGVRPGQSAPLQVDLQDLGSGVAGATVTVSLVQTSVSSPLLLQSAVWPAAGCSSGRQQSLSLVAWVPADLHIMGAARLRVQVEAADHLGLTTIETLEVPIIDDAPPIIRFIEPDTSVVLLPGHTSTVTAFVRDLNSDVRQVQLQVTGPATLQGQAVQVRTIGARTATVSFALHTNALAPPGATVQLQAVATDTATPAVSATADLTLRTCGAPGLTSVLPALGPVAGGNTILLSGQGLAPGLSVSAGPVPLESVSVLSSTLAEARVPSGPHRPGPVTLTASNICGGTIIPEVTVGPAYDFIAAPSLTLMRPGGDGGTTAGARLFVGAGAQSSVPLAELGAQIDGQAAIVQPTDALRANIDGILLVAATASSAVNLTVWALDSLGQRSEIVRQVPLTGLEPLRLSLRTAHRQVGVAERFTMSVFAQGRDQRWRDVTLTASISVDRADRLQHQAGPRFLALSAGTATVTARWSGLQAQQSLQVLQDALVMEPRALHMSHLVVDGSTQAVAAPVQATLLTGGQRQDVTPDVTWSVAPASLAQVQGNLLTPLRPGLAQLRAQGFGLSTTRTVRIDPRLDVAADQQVFVPSGQRFVGGQIDGTVWGIASGPWTLEVDAGGLLEIGSAGALRLEGCGGAWQTPGQGGPGAEDGGAPGAPALSTSSGQPGLSPGSGGGGGGSYGAGGAGGHLMSGTAALAGQSHPTVIGGGGAGPQTAGGGGGGRGVLGLAQASLHLDGLISVAGGAGATGTSTVAGGGGGAGGRLSIDAGALEGSGRILICGGAGGAGSGGGAGAGTLEIQSASLPSPAIDVGWAGGAPGASASGARPALGGEPGSVRR